MTNKEAVQFEHAHLWKDSSGREFYGLLKAETFEPTKQPMDNYISVVWVYDWTADGYGWSTKTKAMTVALLNDQGSTLGLEDCLRPLFLFRVFGCFQP